MAGFFGLFDYSKPGPGVRKDEPQKSRPVLFLTLVGRKFWKLIQLNLLYLLFCIPLVTIGPATAAMTYILRQYATERPVFLFSDFWDQFRSNFKQAFVYGIISILFAVVMFYAVQFYYLNRALYAWMIAPLALCLTITVLFVMANFYIYLMIVTLNLKLTAIMKNGFLLAILCIKSNLITLLVLAVLLFFLIGFFPITLLVFLSLAFSLLWFVVVFNAYPGIQRYAIDPYLASVGEGEDEAQDTLFTDTTDAGGE